VRKTPANHGSYWHSIVLGAHVLRRLGEIAAAESELERALKLTARRPEVFVERAWLRLDQNRVDEGLADVKAARLLAKAKDDNAAAALHALGALLTRKGDSANRRWRYPATALRRAGVPVIEGYWDTSGTASRSALRMKPGVGSRGSPIPKS